MPLRTPSAGRYRLDMWTCGHVHVHRSALFRNCLSLCSDSNGHRCVDCGACGATFGDLDSTFKVNNHDEKRKGCKAGDEPDEEFNRAPRSRQASHGVVIRREVNVAEPSQMFV